MFNFQQNELYVLDFKITELNCFTNAIARAWHKREIPEYDYLKLAPMQVKILNHFV